MTVSLIIDTSSYAGNFERELCKYLTNQTDEYETGSLSRDMSNEIIHLNWWKDHLEMPLKDRMEHPIRSAVQIAPTPGYFNGGRGDHYVDTPENCAIAKERQDEYARQQGWEPRDEVVKYPAYQSVAIFVDEEPPAEVWTEFQARALYFAENQADIEGLRLLAKPFKITAFRIERK